VGHHRSLVERAVVVCEGIKSAWIYTSLGPTSHHNQDTNKQESRHETKLNILTWILYQQDKDHEDISNIFEGDSCIVNQCQVDYVTYVAACGMPLLRSREISIDPWYRTVSEAMI